MSQSKFPSTRTDGTASISARFEVPDEAAKKAVMNRLAEWLRCKAIEGIDLRDDLGSEPHLVEVAPDGLDVVFDPMIGSRYWKDWMVSLTADITKSVEGTTLIGFYDLVSNTRHPASAWRGSE
jgi:hypothetical protein